MLVHRALAALTLLGAVAVGAPLWAQSTSFPTNDAEVYAAALDTLFGSQLRGTGRRLLVVDSTQPCRRGGACGPSFWNAVWRLAGSDSITVAEFEARSRNPSSLEDLRGGSGRIRLPSVTLVARDFYRDLPRTNPDLFWRAFRERFPATLGWATLSAVGYGDSGRQAVVYVEHHCGSLCGAGNLVLLRKTDAGWSVIAIEETWVS